MHKESRGHLLNLSSNELLHPNLPPLIRRAMARVRAPDIATYPTYQEAVEAIAATNGIDSGDVLISAGSDDAIRLAIEAFAVSCGRLVLQTPNYEGWRRHAELRDIDITEIVFGADEPNAFTVSQFERCLRDKKPSVVAISNPNGPTGFAFGQEQLEQLTSICAANGHLLIHDDCYRSFAPELQSRPAICAENEIRIQTFSKTHGLAGARIATVFGSSALIEYLARFRPENAVSGATLRILPELLGRATELETIRSEVMASGASLIHEVAKSRPWWVPLPSSANFINFKTASDEEATRISIRLLKQGIRIRDTSNEPGLEHCVRITLADWSILQKFCSALAGLSNNQ